MIQRRRLLAGVGSAAALTLGGCLGSTGSAASGDGGEENGETRELTLATTTSTYDTGLLDELNPAFESRFDATVKTVSQGTGAALRTARDGDADVVLVHAPEAEEEFVRAGHGVNRREVMYNDFVVVGPAEDPAGVGGTDSATGALEAVADAEATFLSRGDDSGTHKRERQLWEAADADPSGSWYREVGQGMGDTLMQADRSGAYTLADRGTFLAMKSKLELELLLEGPLGGGPKSLRNQYGVIAANPAVHSHVAYDLAMAYIGFLTGPEGQRRIDEFRVDGERLFVPTALSDPSSGGSGGGSDEADG